MHRPFPDVSRPAFQVALFALLFAVLALHCNEGVVDPINQFVMPEIISTYPSAGTVGPFTMISTNSYSSPPNFYVHFNKFMNKSSFTEQAVTVEGFPHRAYARPVETYNSLTYADIMGFRIYMVVPGSTYPVQPGYMVGAKYTVTIDTSITDINGNHLTNGYTFSFTPEPRFRVMTVSPASNDTLRSGNDQDIAIVFNSPVDTATARRALSLQPHIKGTWYPDEYGRVSKWYRFFKSEGIASNTTYTLVVDAGIRDTLGNSLGERYTSRFHTPQFRLTSMFEPISLDDDLSFVFNTAMDTSTIRRAISITPAVKYHLTFNYHGAGSFSVIPDSDWIPATSYTVQLSRELRSTSGQALLSDQVYHFTTDTFKIKGYSPVSSSESYYSYPFARLDSWIHVNFSGRCDTSTFRQALHISPPVTGQFENYVGLDFKPDSLLKPFTVYTVRVDATVRSIRGYTLTRPVVYSFMTGGEGKHTP